VALFPITSSLEYPKFFKKASFTSIKLLSGKGFDTAIGAGLFLKSFSNCSLASISLLKFFEIPKRQLSPFHSPNHTFVSTGIYSPFFACSGRGQLSLFPCIISITISAASPLKHSGCKFTISIFFNSAA